MSIPNRVVKIGSAKWRPAAPTSYTSAVTRRRFVLLVLAGTLAGGGAILSGQLGTYRLDEETRRRLRALTTKQFVVLEVLARRVLAADRPGAPSPDQLGVAAWIDEWLLDADPATRKDVGRMLELVEHATPLVAWRRRRFTDLEPAAQDAYLAGLAQSRIAAVREGMAALKTLCMMGYYRDPRSWAIVGYDGPTVPRGWAGGEEIH